MKKTLLIVTISAVGFVLSACQPMIFGMPQEQWNQLTPEQKTQVIQGYNQRQTIEAQNKPYVDAINTLGEVAKSNTRQNAYSQFPDNPAWN